MSTVNNMIKYCDSNKEREEARELWSLIFNDSKEYLDWYFQNIHEDTNLLLKKDKNVIGMLYENKYSIDFLSRKINIDYLVAVAVDPTRQGEGHMKELLKHTLYNSYYKKIPFQILTPINSNIYEKFGYRYVAKQYKYETELENIKKEKKSEVLKLTLENIIEKDYIEILNLYNEMMKDYDCFIKRDVELLKKTISEIFLENGFILVTKSNEVIDSYAFVLREDGLLVKEFYFKEIEKIESILSVLKNFENYYKKISFIDGERSFLEDILKIDKKLKKIEKEKIQMRVTNVIEFFKMLDFKFENTIIFEIEDSIISENNINIEIKKNSVKITEKDSDIKIKIDEVGQLLLGYKSIVQLKKLKKVKIKNEIKVASFTNEIRKKIAYF